VGNGLPQLCSSLTFCSAEHFQQLLAVHIPQTSSREAAAQWGCHIHNKVNESLNKVAANSLQMVECRKSLIARQFLRFICVDVKKTTREKQKPPKIRRIGTTVVKQMILHDQVELPWNLKVWD